MNVRRYSGEPSDADLAAELSVRDSVVASLELDDDGDVATLRWRVHRWQIAFAIGSGPGGFLIGLVACWLGGLLSGPMAVGLAVPATFAAGAVVYLLIVLPTRAIAADPVVLRASRGARTIAVHGGPPDLPLDRVTAIVIVTRNHVFKSGTYRVTEYSLLHGDGDGAAQRGLFHLRDTALRSAEIRRGFFGLTQELGFPRIRLAVGDDGRVAPRDRS